MAHENLNRRENLLFQGYMRSHIPLQIQSISIQHIHAIKHLISIYYNQHSKILNDSSLRDLSVKFLTSKNYQFIRFIQEILESKTEREKCYNKYQEISNLYDKDVVLIFLLFLARYYDVTVFKYKKGENYFKKPPPRSKQTMLHVSTWLILKYGHRCANGYLHLEFTTNFFKCSLVPCLTQYIIMHYVGLDNDDDLKLICEPTSLLTSVNGIYFQFSDSLYVLQCRKYTDAFQQSMNHLTNHLYHPPDAPTVANAKILIEGYLRQKCMASYHWNFNHTVNIIFTISGGQYQNAFISDHQSLKLSCHALNDGFLHYIKQIEPCLDENRFWSQLDRRQQGKISNRGFWQALYMLAIMYEEDTNPKPYKVNHEKIGRYIKHMAIWIIMTYGKPEWNGWYEIDFKRKNFSANLVTYVTNYFESFT